MRTADIADVGAKRGTEELRPPIESWTRLLSDLKAPTDALGKGSWVESDRSKLNMSNVDIGMTWGTIIQKDGPAGEGILDPVFESVKSFVEDSVPKISTTWLVDKLKKSLRILSENNSPVHSRRRTGRGRRGRRGRRGDGRGRGYGRWQRGRRERSYREHRGRIQLGWIIY